MDEPKNILDAVEDDLAAAGQEPKLFLGMVHYQEYKFYSLIAPDFPLPIYPDFPPDLLES